MNIYKRLVPFGMIGVLSFLLLDILGKIFWPGYDPVTTYISTLVTDEAPHVHLMRFFMNTYTICFLVFSSAMMALSFRMYHTLAKSGYAVMFTAALLSVIGYGGYPISMAFVFSKNDIVHVLVTILILCATALSLLLISVGYLRQEKFIILGRIFLVGCLFFIGFNLWHLYAIENAGNILGLIERFTFYTFHFLTFILSWGYTFRKHYLTNPD